MTSQLNIAALKEFAKAIDKDPNLLFSQELEFLRISLSKYGDFKELKKKHHSDDAHSATGSCDGHAHEHDHASSHDHGHGHEHHESHAPKAAKPAPAPEEEDVEEEPEEVDPELIAPESEPILEVPAGGEGN